MTENKGISGISLWQWTGPQTKACPNPWTPNQAMEYPSKFGGIWQQPGGKVGCLDDPSINNKGQEGFR